MPPNTIEPTDYSGLPRRPFKGRPLRRAELVLTHRVAPHLYFRFEKWWWGTPTAKVRPMHFCLKAFPEKAMKPAAHKQELFSLNVDVFFWREPPPTHWYQTGRSIAEISIHQERATMADEKLLDRGSFIISLN